MKQYFQKIAKEEFEDKERIEKEKSKQEQIRIRAEELELKKLKEDERIEREENELRKVKAKRMIELSKEKFLKKFSCPKCKRDLEIFVSQKQNSLLLWSLCPECSVIKDVSIQEAKEVNFPIFYSEIPVKNFFRIQKFANQITLADVETWRKKQKN